MYISFITLIVGMFIASGIIAHQQIFFSERRYTPWLIGYWIIKSLLVSIMVVLCFHLLVSSTDASSSEQSGSVVFVIDVSTSMDVADMGSGGQTNRKSFVRSVLNSFIADYPGYSYSVIVFADEARTLIPATTDPNILSTFLGSLESFDSLPGGSNFQSALSYTSEFLDRSQTSSYVVLISDGGDEFVDLDMTQIDTSLMSDVLVLGVGSDAGGYVPDGVDPFGRILPKKYQGATVISKINPPALKQIASHLNGDYRRLDGAGDLSDISAQIGKSITNEDDTQSDPIIWWIVIAMCCYISVIYVPWGALFSHLFVGES